jgi:hypothetical protein
MLGDLDEFFEQDCDGLGPERARDRYWGRALRSLWPLLRRAASRLVRWGSVVELARRLFTGG